MSAAHKKKKKKKKKKKSSSRRRRRRRRRRRAAAEEEECLSVSRAESHGRYANGKQVLDSPWPCIRLQRTRQAMEEDMVSRRLLRFQPPCYRSFQSPPLQMGPSHSRYYSNLAAASFLSKMDPLFPRAELLWIRSSLESLFPLNFGSKPAVMRPFQHFGRPKKKNKSVRLLHLTSDKEKARRWATVARSSTIPHFYGRAYLFVSCILCVFLPETFRNEASKLYSILILNTKKFSI
jgi:hypothetical protein